MSSPIRLWNGLVPGTLGGLLLLALIAHAVDAQPGSSPLDATPGAFSEKKAIR